MKKVFLVFMSLIFIMCLAGCGEKEENKYKYFEKENEDIQQIIKIAANKNEIMTYTLSDKIRYVRENDYTFFSAKLNNKEYTIVCGYINEELYIPKRLRDDKYIENVKWVSYNNTSDIKKYVDDLVFSDAFIIYDFLLEKNLINNIYYNIDLKYYRDITNEVEWQLYDGSLFNENININQILLWIPSHYVDIKDLYITDYELQNSLEIIRDNEGDLCVILDKLIVYSDQKESNNLLKEELSNFYDILSTKTIDDEKLDEKIVNDDLSFYIIKKTKLKIDDIINIIRDEVS